jgi:TonB family protein
MKLNSIWCALGILALFGPVSWADEMRQSQAHFEAAIKDRSTSPFVVLLTVVDDRTGQSRTGCTEANSLIGAIVIEKEGGYGKSNAENMVKIDKAINEALENKEHVFHFADQAALDNIHFGYQEACSFIAQGLTARIADITGRTLHGPFVRGPMIDPSSCPPPEYPVSETAGKKTEPPQISFLIAPNGDVKDSKIASSSGSAVLDRIALSAYSACKFSPPTIDGAPASEPAWITFRPAWNVTR